MREASGWLIPAVLALTAVGCSSGHKNNPDAQVPGDAGLPVDATSSCNIYGTDASFPDAGVAMFPTAEAVLDDATVKAAVAAVQKLAAGKVFLPSLDASPPDITGTYKVAQGAAKLVATSDGTQVGSVLGASTTKVSAFCKDALQFDTISTINGMEVTTGTSLAYLRGSGQSYTTYGVTIGVCTEQGSDFTYILANVTAGQIDRAHGKHAYNSLLINLATLGTLTTPCATHLVHAIQKSGGWALIQASGTLTP